MSSASQTTLQLDVPWGPGPANTVVSLTALQLVLGPSPCLEEPSRKAQGAEAVPDKPGPTERKGETAFFTYSQSHQASPETNTLLPYVSKYLSVFLVPAAEQNPNLQARCNWNLILTYSYNYKIFWLKMGLREHCYKKPQDASMMRFS